MQLTLAAAMRARGERGSIVSLLCDRGERYDRTLYDRDWLRARGLDPDPARARLAAWLATGVALPAVPMPPEPAQRRQPQQPQR